MVLRQLRSLQAGEGPRRRPLSRSIRRSSRTGFARRTGSSGCRSTNSRCWITTRPTRHSSSPRSGETRFCGWSRRASKTSRSAAPDSPGGFRCRSTEKSVVYVWFDALINYAAAVGYGWDDQRCQKWWPADLHIIGKDITRFHCVIWPAMLMSARLPLPAQVFGHGWISVGNQRMSKSLGNVIDPIDAAARCGTDPLRLYLTKEVPYGGDGDFTFERLEEKYNADLANNLGNLVSRVSAMTARYRNGQLSANAAWIRAIGRGGDAGGRRLPRRDGPVGLARRCRRCVSHHRRRKSLHCRHAAVGAGERRCAVGAPHERSWPNRPKPSESLRCCCCRSCRRLPRKSCVASAIRDGCEDCDSPMPSGARAARSRS